MRQIALLLVAGACALTACGTTKINSPQYLNGYGDFESKTGYLPTTERPGREWVLFSQGIQQQELAKAYAAQASRATAAAEYIVSATNTMALRQTIAAVVEAARRDGTDDKIMRQCQAYAGSTDPSIRRFCLEASRIITGEQGDP